MQNVPRDMRRERRPASERAGQATPQPMWCRDVGRTDFELKVCQAGTWAAGLQ